MRLEQSLPLLGLLLCMGEYSWPEAHRDQEGGCPGAAEEKASGCVTGFAKYLQPHVQLACAVPVELLLSRVSIPFRVQGQRNGNPMLSGWRKEPKVPSEFFLTS